MVYAYLQDVPIDEGLYRRIIDELGPEPLAGSLLHLCVRRPGGGLRYIDVWESSDACARAFEDRIHRAVDAAFGDARPSSEPEVQRLDIVHATGRLLDASWP
ncbi:hypothetical protein [Mycolicibacterium moriokaense]|uniref:Antibiotic biosynthesis monooxygenase n=1 Tax=Mycolicibacterium moriokaense TaxID=39691 RepID=A0A318H8W7_9MYCO|nr:hypothetical protein [Mycolicibacterium moriokaense]PXX01572.1 hypothetical protein C8E89_12858 [Mycolicibacterium moriokaense]